MRKLFLFAALLLCAWAAAAMAEPLRGALSGVVTGPDGSRLAGALISLRLSGTNVETQAVSSPTGTYLIPGVQAGSYELRALLDGFEPLLVENLEIDTRERTEDLSMRLASIQLVVTVIGEMNRESIEAAETRESSARDVAESMTAVPGVWKIRKGGIGNDIVLRGFGGKDLNVLVDGQRIYGACPNHMDPSAFHVDFSEVDRIEIGKGPFDVRNQGSLGGVVSIVTRSAQNGLHVFGNLSAGSYDFINPSATVSYGRDAFSLLAGYSYRTSSPYTDGSGNPFTRSLNYRQEYLDGDAFRIGTVWTKASFEPFGHLAQISFARQQADHVLYPYLQMDAVYDDTTRFSAGYQVDGLDGLMRSIRIHSYYTNVDHWMTDQYRSSSLNLARPYSMGTLAETKALGGKIEAVLGSVTVGFEALHRKWDAATQLAGAGYNPRYSIPDVRTDSLGLYSEYSRALSDVLRLSFAGRVDTVTTAADAAKANTSLYRAYHSTSLTSRTNNYPSGNLRLAFKTPIGLELSGGIGHTVRVPDARERYFALKRMGTDWVGNPELKPSRNTGLDANLSFRRQALQLQSSLYLDYIDDYVTVVPRSKESLMPGVMNTNARSYENVDARMYGGEFSISYLVSRRLFLSSDLSYVRGTRDVDAARGILTGDLAEIPPLRSRTAFRYDTARFFGEIEAVFTGRQDNVDRVLGEQSTAGYGIANLKAGTSYRRLSLRLALNNIFARRYHEHLSYMRDPFRSGARVYEPGRNFLVHVSYRY